METNLAKQDKSVLNVLAVDLTKNLPDLSAASEMPIDLCGNYWTPEETNESKRLFFVEIKPQTVIKFGSQDELIELDCAVFLEQTENGTVQTVINGSRRLVGVLEQYVEFGSIRQGTPLQITYNGKRKNKSNPNMSDSWSIRPLLIQI